MWGHEHECLITPAESLKNEFHVSQPGSSVATSLVAGEAVQKKVGILHIRHDQFMLESRELKKVRF